MRLDSSVAEGHYRRMRAGRKNKKILQSCQRLSFEFTPTPENGVSRFCGILLLHNCNKDHFVGQVLTAVDTNIVVFKDTAPCSPLVN
jgi:hypothetical protein